MSPSPHEIFATYRGERWRKENPDGTTFAIIQVQLHKSSKASAAAAGVQDVDGYLIAKGDLSEEPVKGMVYRFLGVWETYSRTGERQFKFRTYVPHIAHDPESIANYLTAAGKGNGIGPSKASRLVREIGIDDILEVCRTNPEQVARISGIHIEQAQQFAAILINQQKTENATLELDKLLSGRNFPRSLAKQLIRDFGNLAAQTVVEDPFVTMQYPYVGFKKADALYMQLGKDPRSLDRLALCLWYGMNSDNSGHTWFPAKLAVEKLNREIGGTDIDFRGAITRGKEFAEMDAGHYGAIASMRTGADGYPQEDGGSLWLCEATNDKHERDIVEALQTARDEADSVDYVATWEQDVRTIEQIATHARCARCYRPLTAPSVHILAGKPYGPTCIGYMGGCDEVVQLADWLERNPIVKTEITENPTGWFKVPQFCLWPEPESIEGISDHQRGEYAKASTGRVCILAGSPGTGKTYTVAQIIKAIIAQGICGLNDIVIGAPTGKAAVRMTETLNNAGIVKRARTWASLLWSLPEDGKLQAKIIFGDEESMKDLGLMAAALRARSPGCHVMLIGDPNQLAPVGGGAPFRDMINAGIPMGQLTKIERNDGQIVQACARIRDGEEWMDLCNLPGGNLHWHHESTPEGSLDRLETVLAGLKLWDSQVLVALNEKGPLSRQETNRRLQAYYNADGEPVAGTKFRIGDKVVCLKNSWFESASVFDIADVDTNANGELYVANGELGEVVSLHTKGFVVRIESPRRSIVVNAKKQPAEDESKESATGSIFDLGYALSVHKSQGSEFGHVFILIDDYPGARQVCDASWVLTGISRGKHHTHCIGQQNTAARFCRVQRLDQRKTFLKERIIESQIHMELAGL